MIAIIDYGMGNLYSVSKALERMNVDYVISNEKAVLDKADGYILPGVGAFKDAMAILNETGLTNYIQKIVADGKPLIGICLGMQLLFEESEENGLTKGLSLLPGKVVKIPENVNGNRLKVPHMGWNDLQIKHDSPLLAGIDHGYAYFVHSYYVDSEQTNALLATAQYGVDVTAVVGKDNVYGTQFHPEKSSELGLAILKNYIKIVEGE
ncbi:imidazole glycerol phosphate synthase subunit HisH [Metabacillus sediminilitoris]|jgi:glutamine amidotransferase|uniref:Imidazole glycerol phosphate synthase subunit HisH n=1 Tax=Metabacillus sediminilitoris TaxID=2567941 RepID=A0A4S4C1V9_9BACI|nr:imidazole glycerol phosphate synthase subunit HisH [Metabacillus sediminilitoris]QGQ48053.1 imidazole glycerol phosphate synthase subunit HisH [Metabacillus sediminilitoris]THF81585.1 imidazole glycerol phosphate synthase subunit HisH [Metabacillus sediminilitoris]